MMPVSERLGLVLRETTARIESLMMDAYLVGYRDGAAAERERRAVEAEHGPGAAS